MCLVSTSYARWSPIADEGHSTAINNRLIDNYEYKIRRRIFSHKTELTSLGPLLTLSKLFELMTRSRLSLVIESLDWSTLFVDGVGITILTFTLFIDLHKSISFCRFCSINCRRLSHQKWDLIRNFVQRASSRLSLEYSYVKMCVWTSVLFVLGRHLVVTNSFTHTRTHKLTRSALSFLLRPRQYYIFVWASVRTLSKCASRRRIYIHCENIPFIFRIGHNVSANGWRSWKERRERWVGPRQQATYVRI